MKCRIAMSHGANLWEDCSVELRVRQAEGGAVVLVGGPSRSPLGDLVLELTLSALEVGAVVRAAGKGGGA